MKKDVKTGVSKEVLKMTDKNTAIKQLEECTENKGIKRVIELWNFMCKDKKYRDKIIYLLEDEILDEEGFFHNMTVFQLYNEMHINQAGDVCFNLADKYTWDDEVTGCYRTGTELEDLAIIIDNAVEFVDYLIEIGIHMDRP